MKTQIKGIVPPIVTPLTNNNTLDEEGLWRLIEHLINGGVHGIFLLGTTGEAPHLSHTLRKAFVDLATSIINKRVPVLVGITDTVFSNAIQMAESAKLAGADAVVVSTPFYMPLSQIEFVEYLEALAAELPLPFMAYNMPSCTKFHMEIDTVRKAKELGAIGIKDSSGNLEYLDRLLNEFGNTDEFSVMTGSEHFIPHIVRNGGHGAVPGGANMFPELYARLHQAAVNGDLKKSETLLEKIYWIRDNIYNTGKYESKYIKSIKSVLSLKNICNDFVASPFVKFRETEKMRLLEKLNEFETK